MVKSRNKIIIASIILFSIIGGFNFAQGAITKQINYQGKLTNGSNVAVANGDYDIKFTIYNADSGGQCLWTSKGTCASPLARTVTISSGLFSVMLGDTSCSGCNALDIDFATTTASYYLGVTVGASDSEMTPRKIIGATAMAFNANNLIGDGRVGLTSSSTLPIISITASSTDPLVKLIQNGAGSGMIFGESANLNVSLAPASSTRALLQISDSPLSSGSISGTFIGANPTSFSGNFIDFQVNGSSKFKVSSSGNATTSGFLVIGTTNPTMNMGAGDLLVGGSATTTKSFYVSGSSAGNNFRSDATSTLATTTASVINGVVIVDGVHYPKTSAGIQAAIDAAATSSKVFLPAGVYSITSVIKLPSNITLEGAGPTSTVLSLASGANSNVIQNVNQTTGNTGIKITNLKIDGNDAGNSGTCHGIYMNKSSYVKIENVWIWDVEDNGISLLSTASSTITNNISESNAYGIYLSSSNGNNIIGNITNSNTSGIYLGSSSNNTVTSNNSNSNISVGFYLDSSFENVLTSNNGIGNEYGFYLSNSTKNVLSGNNANGNTSYGIELITNSNNNNITGNNFIKNTLYGIYLSSSSNNVITGNNVNSNLQYGMLISGSANNTISSNTISDNGGSSYDGIRINTAGSDNNLISSNRIYDSAGSGYGINIVAGNYNYIVGNEITGTWTGQINDSGTGTKYTQKERITLDTTSWEGTQAFKVFSIIASSTDNIIDINASSTKNIINVNASTTNPLFQLVQNGSGGGIIFATSTSPNPSASLVPASSTIALLQFSSIPLTSGSSNGTLIGGNLPSSFTGNLIDLQVGTRKFSVNSSGNATTSGYLVIGTTNPTMNMSAGDLLIGRSATTTNTLKVVNNLSTGTAVSNSTTTANFGGNILVQGDANIKNGTLLIDTPSSPTVTGTYAGGITSIYVSGKYAYTGGASNMQIIDVSSPTAPTIVGTYNLSATYDICVSGDYAYVALGTSGIRIINTATTTLIGSYDTPGNAQGIYVSGKYAYVADNTSLQILDISNPTAPTFVGSYGGFGAGNKVYVSGKYAYMLESASKIKIIDVSNPASPVLTGTSPAGSGTFLGIYVLGNYAYVSAFDYGLQIFNVSNPGKPTYVTGLSMGNYAREGIFVSGKYAYVPNGSLGLKIVDISTPSSPALIGTVVSSISYATDVFVSGKYAYVADSNNGLKIIDIKGADIHALSAGSISTDYLAVSQNVDISNDLYVRGGVNLGTAGLFSQGSGAFSLFSTSSMSSLIALSGQITDSNGSSVADILNLTHMASSTASSGIGAGLLFSAEDDSGAATTTARISSILTGTSVSAPTSVLTFSTKNNYNYLTEWMRIDQNGNVGIGLTNPTSTLSVLGSADIRGNATTTGNLIVGASSWAAPTSTLTVNGSGYFTGNFVASGNATTTGSLRVGQLSINDYYFPGVKGSENQILKLDANGNLAWQADNTGGAGGGAAWEQKWIGVITPTTTNAGIFVSSASSTILTLRVPEGLNATTTNVGTLNIYGSATSTGSVYVQGDTTLATTTASVINKVINVDGVHYPQTSAGINAAIAALPSTGGKVFLPEGTYAISSIISIATSSIELSGAGAGTILRLDNSTNKDFNIIGATSTKRIILRDFKIDGNRANQSGYWHRAIFFYQVASSTIENLWIENSLVTGVELESSNNNTIINNNFYNNGDNGMYIIFSDYNLIADNISKENSGYGIELDNSNNNTVNNNLFQKNSGNGIQLKYADNNIVIGNKIYDNTGSTSYDGIRIKDDSDANLISSNNIIDTAGTGYAINISTSNCWNNYLVGNSYSGVSATSINDSGFNTRYTQPERLAIDTSQISLPNYSPLSIVASSSAEIVSITASSTKNIIKVNASSTNPLFQLTQNGAGSGILFAESTNGNALAPASSTIAMLQFSANPLSSGSTSGTYIGANPVSFSGNFLDFQVNGSQKFVVSSLGNATTSGSLHTNQFSINDYYFPSAKGNNNEILKTDANGNLAWQADNSGASAGAAWEQKWVGVITPTTTNAGIYVSSASSTILTLRVPEGLNATTTNVGTLNIYGSATSTGSVYVQGDTTLATTTASVINKVINVDGVHYPQTGAGIQAAINALPSTGGKVFLPEGTYTISATTTIPSNVTLEGAGTSTVLTLANSSNCPVIYSSNTKGVVIANLSINGNKANNAGHNPQGIYLNGASYAKIDRVRIYDAKSSGIKFNNTATSTISNSTLESNGGYGGILVAGGSDNTIISNNVNSSYDSDLTISYGIYVISSVFNIIADNNINNNATGIYLHSGADSNNVTGNFISGNADYTGDGGMRIIGSSNLISSNRIYNARMLSSLFGIYISTSAAKNNYVVGNEISGIWASQILDYGTNTKFTQKERTTLDTTSFEGTQDFKILFIIASSTDNIVDINASSSKKIISVNASTTNPLFQLTQNGAGSGILFGESTNGNALAPASSTVALLQFSANPLSSGSTSGTYIGANPVSFSGNFLDFQVNGSRKFILDSSGNATTTGSLSAVEICFAGANCRTAWPAGGSSNWTDAGIYLTPLTATDGILINSSTSTITNLTMNNATTTNNFIVGTFSWAAPTNTLTVVGSAYFTGNATTSGSFSAGGVLYVKQDTGNVGIGTIAPGAPLDIGSDSGMYLGAGDDLQITVSSDDIYFKQATQDKNIYIQGNDGGANRTLMLFYSQSQQVQIGDITNTLDQVEFVVNRNRTDDTDGPLMVFHRLQSNGAVTDNAYLGQIQFMGYKIGPPDMFMNSAEIRAEVDGTVSDDVPSALVFSTTKDGDNSFTERMRINNEGNVGIGIANPTSTLSVLGSADIRGNATTTGNLIVGASSWDAPTSTLTVNGSGYFTGNFVASGNATTSGYLVIGTTNPTINMSAGDLLVGGSATTTKSFYVSGSSAGNNFTSEATSTLATTTASVINKVINVDGVHYPQSGAGIQAAINALPSTGGKVFLPEGTYTISATTTIPSNVTLEGAGTSTVLSLANSSNCPVIYSSNTKGVVISNLSINGNKANNAGHNPQGIYLNGASYAKIDRVRIYDAKSSGIKFNNTATSTISNSTLESNGGWGGVLVNGGSDNTIINNNINSTYDSTLTTGYGMYVISSVFNIIMGNNINDNTMGIYIHDGANNNNVTGNFISNTSARSSDEGIRIIGSNNIISSNHVYIKVGTGSSGIRISDSSAKNNYIVGNEVGGKWGTTIEDSGTNTKFTQKERTTLDTTTFEGTQNFKVLSIIASSTDNIVDITASSSKNIIKVVASTTNPLFQLTQNGAGSGILFSESSNGNALAPASSTVALLQFSANPLSSGSTSGTYIGANPVSFSGNFLDFQVNGSQKFVVSSLGNATTSGSFHSTEICIGNDCQTSWPAGGSEWTDAGDYLQPNETEGILVNYSTSTITNLTMNYATTTGNLIVGASSWAAPTSTLTVNGAGYFTGNFLASGNATTSGSFYVSGSSVGNAFRSDATSTLATTTASVINKVINVDGVHYPQTSAGINAAITALGSNGGKVFLPEGTYAISETVSISTSSIELSGAGAGTILRLDNSTNKDFNIIGATSTKRIVLRDFKIDGNRANQSAYDQRGIWFSRVASSTIENLWIENSENHGIGLTGPTFNGYSSNDITISNCFIGYNDNIGIYIYGGSGVQSLHHKIINNILRGNYKGIATDWAGGYILISNNIIQQGTDDAIYLGNDGGKNTIIGNNIENNSGAGIDLYSSSYNLVSGNTLKGNDTYTAIRSSSGNNNTITGNSIYYNQRGGIYVGGSYNAILGNALSDNSQNTTNTYNEIEVYGTYNSVIGNTIFETAAKKAKYGIIENDIDDDYNIIQGNIVKDCVTEQIRVKGYHTVVSGNRTSGTGAFVGEGLFHLQTPTTTDQSILTINATSTNSIIKVTASSTQPLFQLMQSGAGSGLLFATSTNPNVPLAPASTTISVLQFGSSPLSAGSANGTYLGANVPTFTGSFIDFQVGGTSVFIVGGSGNATTSNQLSIGGNTNYIRLNTTNIEYGGTAKPKRSIILTGAGATPFSATTTQTLTSFGGASEQKRFYVLEYHDNGTASSSAQWMTAMPDSYDAGTVNATFYHSATTTSATSGRCTFCIRAVSLGDTDAIDTTAWGTSVCQNVTVDTANTLAVGTSTAAITIGGTPSGGDSVLWEIWRNSNDDARVNYCELIQTKIEYSSSQESD